MTLYLILLLGLILRTMALFQHDFWFDEAFTYHIAKLPIKDLLLAAMTDNNPPLYYLLIHFVLKISVNELILRLPSLLFNMLTLFLIYFGFKKYLGRNICLITAMLFAVSPLVLYLSSETRPHSLAVLFAVLIVLSFFEAIKNPGKKNIFIYIVLAILGVYTQYYLLLLLLPFTAIVVKKKIFPFKLWIFIVFAPLIALLPWLYFSSQTTKNICSCPPTWLSLPSVLVSPAIGGVGDITMRVFPLLPQLIFFLFIFTSVLTVIFFFLGILKAKLMVSVFLIPLFVLSIAGLFQPVFSPKAFSIFSPFYFFLIAYGITFFKRQNMLIVILLVFLSLVSLIQLTNPLFFETRFKKTALSMKNTDPYLPVAHTSVFTYYALGYYMNHQKHILLTTNPLSYKTIQYIGGQKEDLDQNIIKFWLVETKTWVALDERGKALQDIFFQKNILKSQSVDGINVYLLEKE